MAQQLSDQTTKELADLLVRLRKNPKTSNKVARLINEVDPTIKFPDVETEDLRRELMGQIDELKNERERDAALRKIAAGRRRVAQSFGEDPEIQSRHLAGVEEVIERTGLIDYEEAAKIYAYEQPKPEPRPEPFMGQQWQAPDTKGLFENPIAWARNEANKAIKEINDAKQR
jgi:hypothetical protein